MSYGRVIIQVQPDTLLMLETRADGQVAIEGFPAGPAKDGMIERRPDGSIWVGISHDAHERLENQRRARGLKTLDDTLKALL